MLSTEERTDIEQHYHVAHRRCPLQRPAVSSEREGSITPPSRHRCPVVIPTKDIMIRGYRRRFILGNYSLTFIFVLRCAYLRLVRPLLPPVAYSSSCSAPCPHASDTHRRWSSFPCWFRRSVVIADNRHLKGTNTSFVQLEQAPDALYASEERSHAPTAPVCCGWSKQELQSAADSRINIRSVNHVITCPRHTASRAASRLLPGALNE